MIKRRILASAALALLLALPAAAQSSDPATNAVLSAVDLCLRAVQGTGGSFDDGLAGLGFVRTSNGGRVKPVGGTNIAATLGANTARDGAPLKVCVVTAIPTLRDHAGLMSAVAAKAGPWNLPRMPAGGALAGGATMDGYANLQGRGVIALAVTDTPAAGGTPANTSVSVIWK